MCFCGRTVLAAAGGWGKETEVALSAAQCSHTWSTSVLPTRAFQQVHPHSGMCVAPWRPWQS